MAPTARFSVPPREAIRLGLDYYDMWISEWGAGPDVYADNSGIQYPPGTIDDSNALPAPAGLAIHPQSDVDRVLIGTLTGPATTAQIVGASVIRTLNPSLSVAYPMEIPPATLPTRIPVSGNPNQPPASLRLFAHPDSIYHATYLPDSAGGVPAPLSFTGNLQAPLLGLRFYLKTPPPGALRRTNQYFPLQRNNLGSAQPPTPPFSFIAAQQNTEILLAIYPVHGRCCATVRFKLLTAATAGSIRVATIDFTETAGGVQLESTLYRSGALAPYVAGQVAVPPAGDWLAIYFTPTTAVNGQITWTVRLTDCSCGPTTAPAP